MNKLHTFAFYALVTPALTLSAGSVLAQYTGNLDGGRLQLTAPISQSAKSNVNQQRQAAKATANHHSYLNSVPVNGMHASSLMGMDVYTNDNEDIGSVDDLIIDANGQVVAIVVGVGGFLGMGEKDVAIGWGNVTRTVTTDEVKLRVDVTRDALKAAPEFIERDQSITDRATQRTENALERAQKSGERTDMHASNNQRNTVAQSRMQHRGHITAVPPHGSNTNNLIGMDVHTKGNESIGSVDDLIIDEDGQVVAIVVSVGGFLGMGQKAIAISWDNVTRTGPADDQELHADVTRDALKAAPEFSSQN
ncbi:hypothetical protein CWE08_08000 [Aliidiomarina iranensis]|uniref:PRC-barrel domain-containing protein n=1 Tax=Aliidiomarina iranensis TaxID=1434071 RepID=A0A432VV98_9GAMM|nr:PRC-barrel domain-containing protein [Aliidiomarina iranensis]RUO20402.1 hypothetical protein CWE08_08000 [Aliidiomarina iranensis]